MSDFRVLSDSVSASQQLSLADIAEAAEQGFALLINNRPDDEEPGQLAGSEAQAAATAAGLGYVAIPVTPGGFSQAQVTAMADALDGASGPVLAYCRSGTRSTFLWALSQASKGAEPDALVTAAAGAGYDIAAIRPTLVALAAQAQG